jgi:hypothetical protein
MNNFADIKEGDYVILPDGKFSPGRLAVIKRVTKTQFVANGARWLRDSGYEVGAGHDPWRSSYARPATPERIELVKAYHEFQWLHQLVGRMQGRIKQHVDDRVSLARKSGKAGDFRQAADFLSDIHVALQAGEKCCAADENHLLSDLLAD